MIGTLRLAAPLALSLLVALLHPARADINLLPDRTNSIVVAVVNNDIEKVRNLLAKGINPNMTDADGRTGSPFGALPESVTEL